MSQFLGGASGLWSGFPVPNDYGSTIIYLLPGTIAAKSRPWTPGALWCGSRGLGGQFGWGGPFLDTWNVFEVPLAAEGGGAQRPKIIGLTKDSIGAALGSCVVQGFVTSTDAYVGEVTSDSGGYYELPTAFAGVAHYLVAYKAGGTDVAGTTVNTIVPV